jgi:hypothetical protein
VEASVDVGRRSLLRRLLDRGAREGVPEPRVAFVDDPTEQRAPGAMRELAVASPGETVPAVATPAVGDPENVPALAESAGGG